MSLYPTPNDESNLSAIKTIRDTTSCKVGWSDHTHDPAVLYRAINRWGADFIEFHLDIDGTGEEFAPGHCWLPDEITTVIEHISRGQDSDGNGVKMPANSELNDRDWRDRPSDGLRPMKNKERIFKSIRFSLKILNICYSTPDIGIGHLSRLRNLTSSIIRKKKKLKLNFLCLAIFMRVF